VLAREANFSPTPPIEITAKDRGRERRIVIADGYGAYEVLARGRTQLHANRTPWALL
jgi:hypothetical protein